MEDIACPRCKTTKYRNPALKLLVNICGHGLCESCVELLFVKGSNACPSCNTPLRRGNFRLQIFEDASVEKEVDIRKKVLKDFNKKEDDFTTLKEYNDYLEEIETIIHNLVYDIDIDTTKRKMEQYKKENKSMIMRNKGKLSREEEELEELLMQEQEEEECRKQQWIAEEKEEEMMKKQSKESLIDNLMFSDMPADQIIASHAKTFIKRRDPTKLPQPKTSATKFSSGIRIGHKDNFLPLPKTVENPLYSYEEPILDLCGPLPPTFEVLDTEKYTQHVRAAGEQDKAGGFVANFACYRALQDALCGLYFTPNQQ